MVTNVLVRSTFNFFEFILRVCSVLVAYALVRELACTPWTSSRELRYGLGVQALFGLHRINDLPGNVDDTGVERGVKEDLGTYCLLSSLRWIAFRRRWSLLLRNSCNLCNMIRIKQNVPLMIFRYRCPMLSSCFIGRRRYWCGAQGLLLSS